MCFSHFGVFLISVKPLTTENTENKMTPKICKITVDRWRKQAWMKKWDKRNHRRDDLIGQNIHLISHQRVVAFYISDDSQPDEAVRFVCLATDRNLTCRTIKHRFQTPETQEDKWTWNLPLTKSVPQKKKKALRICAPKLVAWTMFTSKNDVKSSQNS